MHTAAHSSTACEQSSHLAEAAAEHAPLSQLDRAFQVYAVKSAARVAAQKALSEAQRTLAEAEAAEDEAELAVAAALQAIEGGVAGSSGAVKKE